MVPGSACSTRVQATGRRSFARRTFAPKPVLTRAAARGTVLALALLCRAELASAGIPPAAEKKTVTLKKGQAEAERVFAAECSRCHQSPDPAGAADAKTDCTKAVSEAKAVQVRAYVADVRAGKGLYESRCGRCHDLIPPGSHTSEYWSRNVCTSSECFVEAMTEGQEQQVLLYLMSHAKKE